MITVAIFNQKGGVGKTTLSVNLSAALFRFYKKKVLVMDCDAQNNASEYLMRLGISTGDIPARPHTIADHLKGECDVSDIIYNVRIKDSRRVISSGIDIIASGKDIDTVKFSSINVYRDLLEALKDRYDYCLIDCPPQRMPTALASINASDYILIPIETENDTSFSGYGMAVDLIDEFRENGYNDTLKILGLVITKTRSGRSALDRYMLDQCREQFGDLLFENSIREAQAVNDAFMLRTPVVYYKKSSPVTGDYKVLAWEFMQRIEEYGRKAGV